jgi:hypothetical protein
VIWQDDSLATVFMSLDDGKLGKRVAHARLSRSRYSPRTDSTPRFPKPDLMVV